MMIGNIGFSNMKIICNLNKQGHYLLCITSKIYLLSGWLCLDSKVQRTMDILFDYISITYNMQQS